MALKDITLGQYFPGNTLLHRLDPRTKLLFTVAYIVALFLAKQVVSYAILFVLLAVLIAVSKVGIRSILRGMKPILIIVIITGLLNLFYTRGKGAPLVSFWIFTIYPEGIWAAVFMVLRIAMLITCTFLLTYTTSPILLTDGLEKLIGPLKTLHVPVHELSMMMSIALRFIPTLIEETDKIMSAQKARGADFDTGNLLQKAKALVPLLVPLFISAFRRADELAIAMECRCYHGGTYPVKLQGSISKDMFAASECGCCIGQKIKWRIAALNKNKIIGLSFAPGNVLSANMRVVYTAGFCVKLVCNKVCHVVNHNDRMAEKRTSRTKRDWNHSREGGRNVQTDPIKHSVCGLFPICSPAWVQGTPSPILETWRPPWLSGGSHPHGFAEFPLLSDTLLLPEP